MRRREFIGQAICFGTVFNIPAMDAAATTEIYGKEQMRLGVLSDIHVATEKQLPYVEMAFRFFDRWKAEFAPGTKVAVLPKKYAWDRKRVKHLMTPVEFPPVLAAGDRPRPDDYEVSLEQRCGDSVKTLVRRRVSSSKYIAAEKFDVENVCCLFPELDFPKGGGSVRFAVRPCNAFGRHGKPIYSDWT